MRREPLLLPVAALSAGILAGHFFYFRPADLIFPGSAALAALLLSARTAQRGWRQAAVLSALMLLGMAGQVYHRLGPAPRLDTQDGDTVLLSGCVIDPAVSSPTREQFTLELAPRASARLSLNLKDGRTIPVDYGQRLEVAARVRAPRNFGNPDAFDYAGYLAGQHIYWTGTVSAFEDIRPQPGRCGSRLVGALFTVRNWALERLRSLYPNDPHTAGLLAATLLGETSGIERRWTSDFRVTGTYHALVISGQHVSVLAFTILLLLRLLRMRRLPALGVATVVCWLYAFISGGSSPVVRAAGGFTLFLLASYFFRRTRILNILAAVALVYLLFAPDELFDPSFQLSFLSAAAIAAFAIPLMERTTGPLRESLKRFDQIRTDPQLSTAAGEWRVELRALARTVALWTGFNRKRSQRLVVWGATLAAFLFDTVLISACVQFGLALPMISYFHRLSITGLSANALVIPLLSVVVPLGFASIATGSHLLALLTKEALLWAELVAGWHARFEPAWRIAAIPLAVSILFAVSLVLLAYVVRRRPRWIVPALALALLVFAVICEQPWKPQLRPGILEVSAIDVSQGDSLLVALPDGETMLVDAGGFPGAERMRRKPQMDMGEDVVSPYLWSRRIRRLDYAVLSHGHSDHMGGLPAILDNFHPKELWVGAEPETAEWDAVKQHAAADGVKISSLNRTAPSRHLGPVSIRVLAPSPGYLPADKPANNDSLVLELSYGASRILLTGDAERAVEDELVESGLLQPVTLLKVGHHGSRTSSSEEFLDRLQPQFAFISDGYQNQFHHPHPDVMTRLANHRTRIYRTDQGGLLTFSTDGSKMDVTTFH